MNLEEYAETWNISDDEIRKRVEQFSEGMLHNLTSLAVNYSELYSHILEVLNTDVRKTIQHEVTCNLAGI